MCPSHCRNSAAGQQESHQRGRPRRCLLKGCEKSFWPSHPQARYCSEACRVAARRWRRWHADQSYRASNKGKTKRREQSQRRRQRQRERAPAEPPPPSAPPADAAPPSAADAVGPREGERPGCTNADFSGKPCGRPGCYVLFIPRYAESKQRFCCALCRRALRRVEDREKRFHDRRKRGACRRASAQRRATDTS